MSRDGRTLVVATGSRLAKTRELWYRSVTGDTTPKMLLGAPVDANDPALSPDGKWLAYVTDETGTPEIYVRAFPGPASKWPVSAGGGTEPIWAPDGRHVYYRGARRMMVATVSTSPGFRVAGRDALFEDRFVAGTGFRNYDLSPDGKEFLMLQRGDSGIRVTVVVNFLAEMRAKMAAAKK